MSFVYGNKHSLVTHKSNTQLVFRILQFKWEVTNKELREARQKDRAQRQAQKIKELEKEFHFNDKN